MEIREPIVGEFYEQENKGLCQVKAIAINSVDSKQMAVYQLMYAPFGMFVMPLDEFLAGARRAVVSENTYGSDGTVPEESVTFKFTDKDFHDALLSGKLERNFHGKLTEEQIAEKGFIELLDARNCNEKMEMLIALKPYLTKRMLENFAVTLDLVLDEGDEEEYFDTILSCLKTMERYEGGHLRGQ